MPWKRIPSLPGCTAVKPPLGLPTLFVLRTSTDDTGWIVGPYKDLTGFATKLRHEKVLRDFLSDHRVRIGLRDTDVPPANIERQVGYGKLVKGENYDKEFFSLRVNPVAQPVHITQTAAPNRKSDQEQNVRNFWESQTPQSHHIVEFNNLETVGVSCRDGNDGMDYFQLPAVLLAAEFHQRYISTILKPAHQWNKVRLQSEMVSTYRNLYLGRGQLFDPLWYVSTTIFDRANLRY
jgi:hypothetical protein